MNKGEEIFTGKFCGTADGSGPFVQTGKQGGLVLQVTRAAEERNYSYRGGGDGVGGDDR